MPTVFYRTVHRYQMARDRSGVPVGVARPMLRVRLVGSSVGPEFVALVDSGADTSLFPVEAAHDAGIDLAGCRKRVVRGVGGTVEVLTCRVEIEIEGRPIEIDASFTDDPAQRLLALLGREGVFTEFRFGFDQRAAELLVGPYP